MSTPDTTHRQFEASFYDAVRRWLAARQPKHDVQRVTNVAQDVEAGTYGNPESGSWTEITIWVEFYDSVGARGHYKWDGDMVDLIRAL